MSQCSVVSRPFFSLTSFQLFLTPEFLQENAQYQNHVDRLKELIVEQVTRHHFLAMLAFPRIVSAVTFQEGPEF